MGWTTEWFRSSRTSQHTRNPHRWPMHSETDSSETTSLTWTHSGNGRVKLLYCKSQQGDWLPMDRTCPMTGLSFVNEWLMTRDTWHGNREDQWQLGDNMWSPWCHHTRITHHVSQIMSTEDMSFTVSWCRFHCIRIVNDHTMGCKEHRYGREMTIQLYACTGGEWRW